jgi:hypothetical protein
MADGWGSHGGQFCHMIIQRFRDFKKVEKLAWGVKNEELKKI